MMYRHGSLKSRIILPHKFRSKIFFVANFSGDFFIKKILFLGYNKIRWHEENHQRRLVAPGDERGPFVDELSPKLRRNVKQMDWFTILLPNAVASARAEARSDEGPRSPAAGALRGALATAGLPANGTSAPLHSAAPPAWRRATIWSST